MKKFTKNIIVLLFLFPIITFAQKSNNDEKNELPNPFEFKMIDSVNLSKSEIYTRIRSFVALNFKSAKNVIQMDDKEAGKIICKGIMTPLLKIRILGDTTRFKGNIEFTLNIDIKENKYRCILSDFIMDSNDGDDDNRPYGNLNNEKPDRLSYRKKDWTTIKECTMKEANNLLERIKTSVAKQAVNDDF